MPYREQSSIPTHDQLLILGNWGIHEQWADVFGDMIRSSANHPELLAYYHSGPEPTPQKNYYHALVGVLYGVCAQQIERHSFGTVKEIRGWLNSDEGIETIQEKMKEKLNSLPPLSLAAAPLAKEYLSSAGNSFPFLTAADAPYRLGGRGEYDLDRPVQTLMVGSPEAQLRFIESIMAGIRVGLSEYSKDRLDVIQIGTSDSLARINPYYFLNQSTRPERAYTFDQLNDDREVLNMGTQISSRARMLVNHEGDNPTHTIVIVHQVEKSLYTRHVLPILADTKAEGFHVFATVDASAYTPHLASTFGKSGQVFLGEGTRVKGAGGRIFPSQVVHVGANTADRYWMLDSR